MSKYQHFNNFFDVIANDDKLLRLLVHKSKNLLDDPLSPSKPNIVGSPTYFDVIKQNIIRAPKFTDLPNKAICRICMYLGYNTTSKNMKVFNQDIVFDVYCHIDEYEVVDNRSLKVCDRLNELHEERVSGIGKVTSYNTYPITNAPEGYIGYKMVFSFGSQKVMNELSLLRGKAISIGALIVRPLTLGEIEDIGENKYNSYLNSLLITNKILESSEDLKGTPEDRIKELYELNELELTLVLLMRFKNFYEDFSEAVKIFLDCEFQIKHDNLYLIHNEQPLLVDYESFMEIRSIISKQNYLKNEQSSATYKPANSKAQQLLEKMNKAKEKIQKQNNEDGLSLKDIVSIVANYSNDINVFSVWDLTVYQLYESYLRLILWDDYHNKYSLLPHMSNDSDLDLKHWSVNLNKIN